LRECADRVERGEEHSRDRDADSRSSRAGNDGKQASTKKGLFDDWSKQPVEENQVPHVDHVSGWSRGMSNDVDPNSKPDPAQQGGNKMNSTRPDPSKKGPDIASSRSRMIAYSEPISDKEIATWKGRVGLSSLV